MFDETGSRISELSPADRSELEPISEILQIKGASETHPLLSSLDEFADFEIAGTVPGRPMTLENVKGAWVQDQEVRVESNAIVEYRVHMKVSFILNE